MLRVVFYAINPKLKLILSHDGPRPLQFTDWKPQARDSELNCQAGHGPRRKPSIWKAPHFDEDVAPTSLGRRLLVRSNNWFHATQKASSSQVFKRDWYNTTKAVLLSEFSHVSCYYSCTALHYSEG